MKYKRNVNLWLSCMSSEQYRKNMTVRNGMNLMFFWVYKTKLKSGCKTSVVCMVTTLESSAKKLLLNPVWFAVWILKQNIQSKILPWSEMENKRIKIYSNSFSDQSLFFSFHFFFHFFLSCKFFFWNLFLLCILYSPTVV